LVTTNIKSKLGIVAIEPMMGKGKGIATPTSNMDAKLIVNTSYLEAKNDTSDMEAKEKVLA